MTWLSEAVLDDPSSGTAGAANPESPVALGRQASDADRLILECAGEGIYGLDSQGNTTFANPAALRMIGYPAEEILGKPQHATIHHSHADSSHYPRELCPIYMAIRDGKVYRSESEVFWRKDGTSFPVAYTSTPILDDGRPCGAVVIFQDISERKRREAWEARKTAIFLAITSLQDLESTLRLIADSFQQSFPAWPAFFLPEESGEAELTLVASASERQPVWTRLLQQRSGGELTPWRRAALSPAPLVERCCGDLDEAAAELLGEVPGKFLWSCPLRSSTGQMLGVATFLVRDEEDLRNTQQELTQVCNLARMAIEHHQLHAELLRQSQYDHLTRLPNRMLLEDRLQRALARARRHDSQLAVCYLDLDEFKQVNDVLGHNAGDALLRHVARVLQDGIRDIDTVARQGGDEFILLLPDLEDESEAGSICERILARLQEPVEIEHQMLIPAASMGMTLYPGEAATAGELLRHADLALYAAKRAGRGQLARFSSTLGQEVEQKTTLERELRYALGRGQLSLEYQPIFAADLRLHGFEALLRWHHPTLGLVSPELFVPIAEQMGLIPSIGKWVLDEACHQARQWNLYAPAPVRVFVNVSGAQLSRPDFAQTVSSALANHQLASHLLELEITETWIVADPVAASLRLTELRQLGVTISIDDFGSGHASFTYLQQLPVDLVKIDRAFISCLDGTSKQSAIVRAIVALASELGLKTIAEGIETAPQLAELGATECTFYQGFLLSPPIRGAATHALIGTMRTIPLTIEGAALTTDLESVALADPLEAFPAAPIPLEGAP